MAMYSVFDPDTQRYDYFQGTGPELGQRVPIRAKGLAGVTPEAVLARLPVDALHVGSGQDPRGVLAVREGGGLGGFGTEPIPLPFIVEHPYITAGIAVGAIMLLYKVVTR